MAAPVLDRLHPTYGVAIGPATIPLAIELHCIRKGGRWKTQTGRMCGLGMEHHFREAIKLIWPESIWHRWNNLLLKEWLTHRYVGILGPTNGGKTHFSACAHLLVYYCFPESTTVLICSTTRDRLEDRIWGEMKKLHRQATSRYRWLPGHLIEGKQRIVTDDRSEADEGRDFRNGVIGVPCLKGSNVVGLSAFIGIKNKHLYLCGDELQLLPKAFIDSLSNLMKGAPGYSDRKVTGMGNPSDTLDSLGILCEPAASLGGWDGGIDQLPKSKTWETRWPNGVCIQLCGSDSPNMEVPRGAPAPYPFLITRENMEDDAKVWGVDDWHYTMFNEGRMPRGQGSRRVITRQMCQKFGAMKEALWANSNRTDIVCLDAAFRGVGGDRCVLQRLRFGEELSSGDTLAADMASAVISQKSNVPKGQQIIELVESLVIPIDGQSTEPAEDQIVQFVSKYCQQHNIPPDNFFYDAGMRSSLVQAFGRLWSTKTNAVDFGGRPSDRKVSANIDVDAKDYYYNFVSELWFTVRMIIECGQFRNLAEDVMLEGCAREWKKSGMNKIQVETKDELKKKTGRSPDLFDCLVAGCWGAIQKGFQIKRFSPKEERRDHSWKRELLKQAEQLREAGQLNYTA